MALLTFLALNLNGMKTLMGFIRQHAGFLSHPKAKITKFGDKQASKVRVRTKYFFIRCTQAANLEAWAPQLEWLGTRRAPQNFYLGDQLWGLGTLVKILGKGLPEIFLRAQPWYPLRAKASLCIRTVFLNGHSENIHSVVAYLLILIANLVKLL